MTEEERKPERLQVALTEEASQKIDRWRAQIETKCNVELSRRALLNWYITKSAENLSSSDLAQISLKFYDEEKFLKSLLQKIKRAKETGTEAEVEVVIRHRKTELKKESAMPDAGEDEDSSSV